MASKDGPTNRLGWGLLLLRSSKGDPCTTAATVSSIDPRILLEYIDYADLFNKEAANALPSYRSIYGLTPIEVEVLQKEVDKNLEQKFI